MRHYTCVFFIIIYSYSKCYSRSPFTLRFSLNGVRSSEFPHSSTTCIQLKAAQCIPLIDPPPIWIYSCGFHRRPLVSVPSQRRRGTGSSTILSVSPGPPSHPNPLEATTILLLWLLDVHLCPWWGALRRSCQNFSPDTTLSWF